MRTPTTLLSAQRVRAARYREARYLAAYMVVARRYPYRPPGHPGYAELRRWWLDHGLGRH